MAVKALYPGTFDPPHQRPRGSHPPRLEALRAPHRRRAQQPPAKTRSSPSRSAPKCCMRPPARSATSSVATFDGPHGRFRPARSEPRPSCAASAPSPTTSTNSDGAHEPPPRPGARDSLPSARRPLLLRQFAHGQRGLQLRRRHFGLGAAECPQAPPRPHPQSSRFPRKKIARPSALDLRLRASS